MVKGYGTLHGATHTSSLCSWFNMPAGCDCAVRLYTQVAQMQNLANAFKLLCRRCGYIAAACHNCAAVFHACRAKYCTDGCKLEVLPITLRMTAFRKSAGFWVTQEAVHVNGDGQMLLQPHCWRQHSMVALQCTCTATPGPVKESVVLNGCSLCPDKQLWATPSRLCLQHKQSRDTI